MNNESYNDYYIVYRQKEREREREREREGEREVASWQRGGRYIISNPLLGTLGRSGRFRRHESTMITSYYFDT